MMSVDVAFKLGLLHDLDWICGSPVPHWLTSDEERFRWLAARELAYGIAVSNRADPTQVTMFVTMSTRSIFASPEIPTFGERQSLVAMLEAKCVRDARDERRRLRRQRRWRLLRRG